MRNKNKNIALTLTRFSLKKIEKLSEIIHIGNKNIKIELKTETEKKENEKE